MVLLFVQALHNEALEQRLVSQAADAGQRTESLEHVVFDADVDARGPRVLGSLGAQLRLDALETRAVLDAAHWYGCFGEFVCFPISCLFVLALKVGRDFVP
jgi:hypothetical protein